MRYCTVFIFLLISQWGYSQSLIKSGWIKFKAERKDSSRIVDRLGTEASELKYTFTTAAEVVVTSAYDVNRTNWSLKKEILSIGPLQEYVIEQLNDSFLVIVENFINNPGNDKINRFYFINEKYYQGFLLSHGLIQFLNDTTILCNRYFYPHFAVGNTDTYLMDNINSRFNNAYLIGEIIVAPDKAISEIKIDSSGNANDMQIAQIIKVLKGTGNKWILPSSVKPMFYKLNFSLGLMNNGKIKSFFIKYNTQEKPCFENCDPVSPNDLRNAHQYYEEGLKYLMTGNENDAISKFTQCITHDPLYLDAYYNRAYSFYKLKMYNKACLDWEYLKDLGQKEGCKLYLQNCKPIQ